MSAQNKNYSVVFLNGLFAECQRRDPSLEPTPGNLRKVMESFIRKIRFPLMNSNQFSLVERTGLLDAVEIQQIKRAISSKEKDKTAFDFNPRVGKDTVQNFPIISEKCYGTMPNVTVQVVIMGKITVACIPCALKCNREFSNSSWYPSYDAKACNCKNSGQCILNKT